MFEFQPEYDPDESYQAYDEVTGEHYITNLRFEPDDHFYSDSPAGICKSCGHTKRVNEQAIRDNKTGLLTFLTTTTCSGCDRVH